MCNQNEWIVREAFLAYDRGDVTRMMDFVDPEVDWTYRDPDLEDSEPQVCHGRGALEKALRRQADLGLRAQLAKPYSRAMASWAADSVVCAETGWIRRTAPGSPPAAARCSSRARRRS